MSVNVQGTSSIQAYNNFLIYRRRNILIEEKNLRHLSSKVGKVVSSGCDLRFCFAGIFATFSRILPPRAPTPYAGGVLERVFSWKWALHIEIAVALEIARV